MLTDRAGCGRSDGPPHRSVTRMADELLGIIRASGIPTPVTLADPTPAEPFPFAGRAQTALAVGRLRLLEAVSRLRLLAGSVGETVARRMSKDTPPSSTR